MITFYLEEGTDLPKILGALLQGGVNSIAITPADIGGTALRVLDEDGLNAKMVLVGKDVGFEVSYRYEFRVYLTGYGFSEAQAWEDAISQIDVEHLYQNYDVNSYELANLDAQEYEVFK